MNIPVTLEDKIHVGERVYKAVNGDLSHVTNEHGVTGRLYGDNGTQFVPECCIGCRFLDSETYDDYYPAFYYCQWNQRMPTRKGTCKRFEKMHYAGDEVK